MSDLVEQIKADREAGTPQTWAAEITNCRDLPDTVWAIVWDRTPGGRKNDDGSTSYSLRFPMLLCSEWMADPEEGMTEIADALNYAERAKARIEAQAALIAELTEALSDAVSVLSNCSVEAGHCCCGDSIESHGFYSGHSPVDMGAYSAEKAVAKATSALARAEEAQK